MMRITRYMAVLMMILSLVSSCQYESIPAAVKEKLIELEPEATDIDWSVKHNMYRAQYLLYGKKGTSYFQMNGIWTETELVIDNSELPLKVAEVLQEQFAKFQQDGIEKVETSDGKTFYEVDMIYKGNLYDILFDANGKILRKNIW